MNPGTGLHIHPIKTRIFRAGEDLLNFVDEHIPDHRALDGAILAVTSKIVSLAENRRVPKSSISKRNLIEREAEVVLGEIGYGSILTIKEGHFIASAGIDESNSEDGHFILYPENPFASAERLCRHLRRRAGSDNVGVLFTDSRTTPLRLGVTGISLAHWGFRGLLNKVGQKDLFGSPLQMTKVNTPDSLAATATLLMGEADEAQPLALIRWENGLEFMPETDPQELRSRLEEDLYYPFFKPFLKVQRGPENEK